MKYMHYLKNIPLMVLCCAILAITCDKDWDEHYNEGNFNLPEYTIYEYIKGKPDLSIFSRMLSISGYDKILSASQSYTVWAPNNAALATFDTTDVTKVKDIVQNHITRGSITTSGIELKSIRMLNGKFIDFAKETSGYSFGSKNITELNIPANNGLIHIINGFAPFQANLWEFIQRTDNFDSLRAFLNSQTEIIFDPVNSVAIGTNTSGQIVYDSVFKVSNSILEKLGAIDNEDSVYTAIFPNNIAWNEAYSRIESYYNFPDDGGGKQRQREKTQFALVQDMLFRGKISDPQNNDSLVSTYGNVFYNPGQLFADISQTENLSNGISNITSKMPFPDTISWFKEIRVEAENLEGRTNTNSVIFSRNSYGSKLDVSKQEYILVDPLSAGSSVKFSIPNTLSAKYNIYCVFVPAGIVTPTDITPTKVKFKFTYIRIPSGSTSTKLIVPNVNTTYPIGLTKMFVEQFDFEFANVTDEDYDRIAVQLEVINDVTSDEEKAGEYSRTMRIDCIILEPVTE